MKINSLVKEVYKLFVSWSFISLLPEVVLIQNSLTHYNLGKFREIQASLSCSYTCSHSGLCRRIWFIIMSFKNFEYEHNFHKSNKKFGVGSAAAELSLSNNQKNVICFVTKKKKILATKQHEDLMNEVMKHLQLEKIKYSSHL